MLRLTSILNIEPCRISITVPSTFGIRTLFAGLKAVDSITALFSVPVMDAKISAILSVNTGKMIISQVSGAAALFDSPSMKFRPAKSGMADSAIAVQVGLIIRVGLKLLGTISIVLPSFGAPHTPKLLHDPKITETTFHLASGPARFTAQWNSFHQHLVMMITHGHVSPGDTVNITIPSDWGIILPVLVVYVESGVMIIVQEAQSGIVWRSAFESLDLIGVFVEPSVSFTGNSVMGHPGELEFGRPVAMSLKFALTVPVMTGHCVSVMLPGIACLPFSTLEQTMWPQSLEIAHQPLLPSNESHCRATIVDKVLLTNGEILKMLTCEG